MCLGLHQCLGIGVIDSQGCPGGGLGSGVRVIVSRGTMVWVIDIVIFKVAVIVIVIIIVTVIDHRVRVTGFWGNSRPVRDGRGQELRNGLRQAELGQTGKRNAVYRERKS